jgi:pantoate--beta-alanine ligase
MQIIDNKQELINLVNKLKQEGKSIGLVPTMGALHEGHVSLVNRCVNDNDICITSIFVNPTQFNNPSDLDTYPRDLAKDVKMLEEAECDYVFTPTVEDIYPEPDTRIFDFGYIDTVMEGANRPGHFNGVGQVVSKLFRIINADNAYFGMKDFQQVAVINKLVEIIDSKVKIVKCPIIREDDGLAKSSRNMLLTEEHRKNAPHIYATLTKAITFAHEKTVQEIEEWVINEINSNPFLSVEYFQIIDDKELTPVSDWAINKGIVGCITVQAGNIRLIDNITFK